jgi:6-pyruvoyltetrahydropterin/6-carboxytetrahydropterin synthase
MRTRVTRSFTFDAAHMLPWHAGKCRNLHGHTYRLEVSIEGPLGSDGIVTDFADLDTIVRREVIDRFDHVYLNDLLDNPTAELIAADIWKRLEHTAWGGPTLALAGLRLWETPDSSVELFR